MNDHRRFREMTAGYVLGILDTADRREFEDHLQDCARCRDDVTAFAPIPGLLARAAPTPTEAVPGTVVDGAVERVQGEWIALARSRRRWRWVGAVALVLAVVAAGLGFSWGGRTSGVALVLESDVVAGEVLVEAKPWGSALHLDLDGLPRDGRFAAWLVDAAGVRELAATWRATPAGVAVLDGASAMPADRVVSVEVTDSEGGQLLLLARRG